jgi:predicted negative regulator of RcsB-dependent stress response
MTTPTIPSNDLPASQPKPESFLDWYHINSRWITIGAVVVGVGAFGAWFVQRTSLNETINSDKQLQLAEQSLKVGNAALAENDLKKVADKYPTKPAGTEAGLILAELRLDRGDAAAAVSGLRDLSSKVSKGPNAAQVSGLLADALAQQNKPAEAAIEYERAASLTSMPNEKNVWLSKAGRAYITAAKPADARKIFEILAAQTDNESVAMEAHVRLGELSVGTKM